MFGIRDTVNYLGENFSLMAVEGRDIFVPEDFGLNPISGYPTVRAGYIANYAIEGELFLIRGLTVPEIAFNYYPEICGVRAENGHYKLKRKLNFTGFITIARDYFGWSCRTRGMRSLESDPVVLDVAIRNGEIFSVKDVSKEFWFSKQLEAAGVRREPASEPLYFVPSDTNPCNPIWRLCHYLWARDMDGEWPKKRPLLNILLEEMEANLTDHETALYLRLPEISASVDLEISVESTILSPLKKEEFEKLVLELLDDELRNPAKAIPSRYWNLNLVATAIVAELGRRVRRKAEGLILARTN